MLYNPFGQSSGGSSPSVLALDPPVETSFSSNVYHAYGFDRMVQGYTGDTVRLKRLSDNAEADFGFSSSTGIFDLAAVNIWRSSADVDVVKFYDQTGTAITLDADSTVSFVRSDVVKRFGTTFDTADETLTRSTTDGGVGCDLAATGAFRTSAALTCDIATDGLNSFMLYSMNTRKVTIPANDDYSGNNAREGIIAYGTGSTNSLDQEFNSTFGKFADCNIIGGGADDDAGGRVRYKQNAQHILSMNIDSTGYEFRDDYQKCGIKTWSAGNSTQVSGGGFDNGFVAVGAVFSNTSGDLNGSNRGNFVFGGIIIAKSTTSAFNKYKLQCKLSLIGQQHKRKSVADIQGLFEERILLKDINTGTGVATGEEGQTNLTFNTGTVTEGTSSYTLDHTDTITGLQGVYSDDCSNAANGFEASNTYFTDVREGTILSFHMLQDITGVLPTGGGQLVKSIGIQEDSQYSSDQTGCSLAIGFDHGRPALWSKVGLSVDVDAVTGTRKAYPRVQDGDAWADRDYELVGDSNVSGGGGGQALGKYNRNTYHGNIDLDNAGKVMSITFPAPNGTLTADIDTAARWANEDPTMDIYFDAPVRPNVGMNYDFESRYDVPMVHVGTFTESPNYVHSNGYTSNREFLLEAVNKSYVTPAGGVVGHNQGSLAINNNASMTIAGAGAKLRSGHYQKGWEGSLFAFMFSTTVLTQAQIEEVTANFYKLLV